MATERRLSYTASEIDEKLGKIDRLAEKSEIPAKISELTNDSGFVTRADTTEFVVSVSGTADSGYTADKTYAETRAAYESGRTVVCSLDADGVSGFRLPLSMAIDDTLTFIAAPGAGVYVLVEFTETYVGALVIPMSLTIGTEMWDMTEPYDFTDAVNALIAAKVPTIPTALKNPNALTINGTSYDGSAAVDVNGLATETYVNNKVASMVDSAPDTLNTLNELAAALGDDPNFATTVATQIGSKVDKVDGKGLSTNDYTTTEKNKLAGIAEGANKTVVDTALSGTSANPVQNNVVKAALDKKPGEIVAGKTYTIDGETVTAKNGAEVFNDYSNNKAIGVYSHAEGGGAIASGNCSHAEGSDCIASAYYSHAEGSNTTASGNSSHAEGSNTTASGNSSHAEGYWTTASSSCQHVQGIYNIEDANNQYLHIVGNGSTENGIHIAYSNAHTLDWNGLGWFAGGLKVGGAGQDDSAAVNVALVTDIPSDSHINSLIDAKLASFTNAEEVAF